MTTADVFAYYDSLATELLAQADRVRSLIGDAHFLTDGHHKENLLRHQLLRYLPSGITATRGFLLSPQQLDSPSKEQDIVLIDRNYEIPFFFDGDVVIAPPRSAVAALSVKSTMDSSSVADTLNNQLSAVTVASHDTDAPSIYIGGYYFRSSSSTPSTIVGWMTRAFEDAFTKTNGALARALGSPWCYVSDRNLITRIAFDSDGTTLRISLLDAKGLAVAFLFASILQHVQELRSGRTHADTLPPLADLDLPVIEEATLKVSSD